MNDHPQPRGTTRLYRPTGPEELALVEASGFTKWPPTRKSALQVSPQS